MSHLKLEPQALANLIECFLCINHHPSDQQFHALAEAIGADKETLEAVAYSMLHEELEEGEEGGEAFDMQARSSHFPNDSTLMDPDCEYSEATDDEDGTIVKEQMNKVEAVSTHTSNLEADSGKQDSIDELFSPEASFDGALGLTARTAKRIQAARKLFAETRDEEVMQGEADEHTLTPREQTFNDGQLEVNEPNPGFQEEQFNDGATALDPDIAVDDSQSLQNQDGLVDPLIVEGAYTGKDNPYKDPETTKQYIRMLMERNGIPIKKIGHSGMYDEITVKGYFTDIMKVLLKDGWKGEKKGSIYTKYKHGKIKMPVGSTYETYIYILE